MKLDEETYRNVDRSVRNSLDQITLILNNGKVSAQVTTTPPTWAARNGEFVFLNSAGATRVYFYASNQWNFVSGDTGGGLIISRIVKFTRDMTAASGSVSYTGLGFVPTMLIAISPGITGEMNASWGFSDKNLANENILARNDGSLLFTESPQFLNIQQGEPSAGSQTASVSTYDSDGFTFNWTKSDIPTGTATIKILCLR